MVVSTPPTRVPPTVHQVPTLGFKQPSWIEMGPMPSESPWRAQQNNSGEPTLNLPAKCELEGPHCWVAAVSAMVWLDFGGLFWTYLGDSGIAMDSPCCKEAMRLGPGSMHGVFSDLGVGGWSDPPQTSFCLVFQNYLLCPPREGGPQWREALRRGPPSPRPVLSSTCVRVRTYGTFVRTYVREPAYIRFFVRSTKRLTYRK